MSKSILESLMVADLYIKELEKGIKLDKARIAQLESNSQDLKYRLDLCEKKNRTPLSHNELKELKKENEYKRINEEVDNFYKENKRLQKSNRELIVRILKLEGKV